MEKRERASSFLVSILGFVIVIVLSLTTIYAQKQECGQNPCHKVCTIISYKPDSSDSLNLVPVVNPAKGSDLLPSKPLVPVVFPKDTNVKPVQNLEPINPVSIPQQQIQQQPTSLPPTPPPTIQTNSNTYFDVLNNIGYAWAGEGSSIFHPRGPRTASVVLGVDFDGFKNLISQKVSQEEFNKRVLAMPKEVRLRIDYSSVRKDQLMNSFFIEAADKMIKAGLITSSDKNLLVHAINKYLQQNNLPQGTLISFTTGSDSCFPSANVGNSVVSIKDPSEIAVINKFFSASLLLRDDSPKGLRGPDGKTVESPLDRMYRKYLSGTYTHRGDKLDYPLDESSVERM
jgi:hypothetical protein